jgi:hypothetical protein
MPQIRILDRINLVHMIIAPHHKEFFDFLHISQEVR